MNVLSAFNLTNIKNSIEQAFSDVELVKVIAGKGTEIVLKLKSFHLIDFRDEKGLEAALNSQFFERSGRQARLKIEYELSSQYDPKVLWEMNRKSILEELKSLSRMNWAFLEAANVSFSTDKDKYTMVLSASDSEFNRVVSKEVAEFLYGIFNDRFSFDMKIDFEWTEPSDGMLSEEIEEVYYYTPAPEKSEKDENKSEKKTAKKRSGSPARSETSDIDVKKDPNKHSGEPAKNDQVPAEPVKKADENKPVSNPEFKARFAFEKKSFGSKFIRKALPDDPELFWGKPFDLDLPDTPISEITEEGFSPINVHGKIFKLEEPKLTKKGDRYIIKFLFTDFTDSITAKLFPPVEDKDELLKKIGEGKCIRMSATPRYDSFDKEIGMADIVGIRSIPDIVSKRQDNYPEKRVELHAHTQYSDMDGITSPEILIKTAYEFGHPGVAITDHGVVQGFTPAFHYYRDKIASEKDPEKIERAKNFKIIYGCEIYLVNDICDSVINDKGQSIYDETVVFDLETTGKSKAKDKIIEIGAVKLRNNEIVDRFSTFVNPERPIPPEIESLTHINDNMVKDAPVIEEILPSFLDFCKGAVIVAHNASFDTSFIKRFAKEQNLSWDPTVCDTLAISKVLLQDLKNHKLDTVADELHVVLAEHHRAVDDAECTAGIYVKLCEILATQKNITMLSDVAKLKLSDESISKLHPFHCIVLCKNDTGRVNLYKMISKSHLVYFRRTPKIPKSLLRERREGLIIGAACEQGELFRAVLEESSDDEISALCDFYDYYEIQPLGNNRFLIDDEKFPNIRSNEDLCRLNEKIVELGEIHKKPVCATCDTHFLNPEDEVYRRIIMYSKGFSDADNQAPLYFRTTKEMLDEFDYLGTKKCHEVVIENTLKIYDMIEKIEPVRPDKCPPKIENSDETLRMICEKKAHSMYGDNLPEVVEKRLETELSSIIKNGYSVLYIIAQKLVWKSNEDGYLVGSRGSVGSSFVATMAGISEINPLPAHYYCKKCRYTDFESELVRSFQKQAVCGFDMPDRVCPVCGEKLQKDGCDIPFETFLGFNCDKEPDIDLNYSSEYQAKAHDYTEVIFGKGHTFKAGTVGTVADKTAYGYALKYDEGHQVVHRAAELERISAGCVGVRRSTGQHPGGIVVLPMGEDIDTFTPVQHPANDIKSNIVTTHFDYHSIDHNLLKLDILGHEDPTMIKRLEELTGIDAKTIPMDDKDVISLFHGTEALGIKPEDINGVPLGSLGIPELGTDNAINMLCETKPDCFSDMVRVSGLSHGTDVWANNTQTLIQNGICTLKNAICTRDDIMLYLINQGMEPGTAFKIMENVRKGKVAKHQCDKWVEWKEDMKAHGVPDWYIGSCEKIQYMFPKAHAAAYIMMAFRVAWYKVHRPLEYYAAYFGIRADAFDYEKMCLGKEKLIANMNKVKELIDNHTAKDKDETTYMNMKSVLEMYARGYEFTPIDIFKAKAHAFQVIDGKVMPSFDSLQGLGEKASDLMFEGCKGGPFLSKEEFKERTKAPQKAIDTMARLGLLGDLPDTAQMNLADIFDMS